MIIVIDYKTANIGSMLNMLAKAGTHARVAEHPKDLNGATKLILPGIGHFDTCARKLKDCGFFDTIIEMAIDKKIPLLGVCVGAQLLTRGSEEGNLPGLNLISAEVKRFTAASQYKVPHMGWNQVSPTKAHSLFGTDPELANNAWRFYFVHSYYIQCDALPDVLATTQYGHEFASAIGRDHVAGLQFHPEKSHRFGLKLLKNFAQHGIWNEQVNP